MTTIQKIDCRKNEFDFRQEKFHLNYFQHYWFLKNFLLDLNLVSERACYDKHFRIGRSLNPDVRQNQRDEFWLYDDVSRKCGKEVARLLWEAWLKCRNQVFHYFPDKPQLLNLETAISRLKLLEEAMEAAVNCLKQSNL